MRAILPTQLQITSLGVDAMVPTGGGGQQLPDQSTRINNKLGHAVTVVVNHMQMAGDTTVQPTTQFVIHVESWDILHGCVDVGDTTNSLERAIITRRGNNANNLVEDTQDVRTNDVLHVNDVITSGSPRPYYCTVYLNGVEVVFEIDTGAGRTLLCEHDYYRVHSNGDAHVTLERGNVPRLRSYSGNIIDTVGCIEINVKHNTSQHKMAAIVVKSRGPNLLGRDWLATLKLDWSTVARVEVPVNSNMFDNYSELFKPELGTLKDIKVKFNVKHDHVPMFCKARPVPYSMKEKVDTELDKLVEQGVLKPVQHSDYASPIVSVLKPDGNVRICADYKRTLNTMVSADSYPIPDINEL